VNVLLKTESLILRELSLTDLDNIHLLHSLSQTDKYNTLGIPGSIDTTKLLLNDWLKQNKRLPRKLYILSIELKEIKQFIGLVALKLGKQKFKNGKVWYKLIPSFWRKGYATEALLKLLQFGFIELDLHRIEAGCAVENIASIKVLEKIGMIREGKKRKALPIRGEWLDNYWYAILKEDFNQWINNG
jgi:RimJ/RimL family protein N-acetyltransferase